jgi:hypothetical protein
LRQAAEKVSDLPADPPTTLTLFIHFLRLKMIESKIEFSIYRVDSQNMSSPAIVQGFVEQLSAWKQVIPRAFYDQEDTPTQPFHGIEIFVSEFHSPASIVLG